MKATGKIIVLAYPDTFVAVSDEWICKFLPLLGLGTRRYIKAGHAALVLIENETKTARYFDFGRYVTPPGHGRVRGANTDAELEIPFKAKLAADNSLENIHEFLLWLDANPQKTHGEGRLLASVCENVNFEKAEKHIRNLQEKGSVRYGAFSKTESNCSRFVTDTLLAATKEKHIYRALKFNKLFTPSAIGNVEKAATSVAIYEVQHGSVGLFNGTAFKENIKNYFHRKKAPLEEIELPLLSENAQKLSGTGSNAWFELSVDKLANNQFRIKRFNDLHENDFDGVYEALEAFDPALPYRFTYDSNCEYCHILQNDKKIRFDKIGVFSEFNSLQKVHSA